MSRLSAVTARYTLYDITWPISAIDSMADPMWEGKGHSPKLTTILLNACHAPDGFLWHSDFTQFNFGWGSAPDPVGGAYDAPQTPSWLRRGIPPSHTHFIPHLFDAIDVSLSTPLGSRLGAFGTKKHTLEVPPGYTDIWTHCNLFICKTTMLHLKWFEMKAFSSGPHIWAPGVISTHYTGKGQVQVLDIFFWACRKRMEFATQ